MSGNPPSLTRSDIIALLRDMAALLEYHGENQFKIRAYENAARSLASETAPLEELVQPGRLEQVKGVGKGIAEVIREAFAKGESPYHQQLRAGTPAGIYQLMQVPNLGMKKIKILFEKLAINTIEELEAACAKGEVEPLKGFGKKTTEKVLAGICQYRQHKGRSLYYRAAAAAEPLFEALKACPHIQRVEVAGSLRRLAEVVGDLDFVAASNEPQQVMDYFIALPMVSQVIGFGPTKSSVLLHDDIQADLRVVTEDQFGSALHHFTGSKEHNVAMRSRALKMGYRVNEYGVFRLPPEEAGTKVTKKRAEKYDESIEGHRIVTRDETDVFRALGLRFIPPEMREGMGEIELAEWNELPELITMDDYRGVIHCHSTWSDGVNSIRDLALAARDEWGFEYLAVCDHSELAAYAGGIKKQDLEKQHAEIDELNAELASDKFRILKSCECDILADGSMDYPDEYLAKMDLVVASIHSRFQMESDEMTARLMRAMDNPYMTILGHMSGRLLLNREPYAFDLEKVLRHAAATGTIIEINADPHRLDMDWRYCRRAKEMGIQFAVNPDAHSAKALAVIQFGINMARKGWLTKADVINCLGLKDLMARVKVIREKKMKLRASQKTTS